jgi:hypothetical protein
MKSFESICAELKAEEPVYPKRAELVVFVNDDRAGARCLVPDDRDQQLGKPRLGSFGSYSGHLEDAVLDLVGDDPGPIRITIERTNFPYTTERTDRQR